MGSRNFRSTKTACPSQQTSPQRKVQRSKVWGEFYILGPRIPDVPILFRYMKREVRTLDRRFFLKIGIGGAAVLAVGGVGLGLRPTVMVPVEGALRHLNPRQYAIFTAMVDAFVSPTADMPDVQSLNVGQTIDGMLDSLHPDDVTQLLQAVGLIENALAGFVLKGEFKHSVRAAAKHADSEWLADKSLITEATSLFASSGVCCVVLGPSQSVLIYRVHGSTQF